MEVDAEVSGNGMLGDPWRVTMRRRLLGLASICGMLVSALWPAPADAADRPQELTLLARLQGQNFQVVTVDLAKKSAAAVEGLPPGAREPNWSADGKQLLFVLESDGTPQIWRSRLDGKEPTRLTNFSTRLQQPAFSPDAKKVVLTLVQENNNHEIFTIDADGSNPANVTNDPSFDADASWSPDGKRILFTSNRNGAFRLFVMDADGANVRQISDFDLAGWVYPSWSPDGAQVLFGGIQPDQTRQVFVANADGQGIEPLTEGPGVNAYPAWSPDGRYIAYLHFDKRPDQSPEGGRLKILDVDTGEHAEVAPNDMRCAAAPVSWKPASK